MKESTSQCNPGLRRDSLRDLPPLREGRLPLGMYRCSCRILHFKTLQTGGPHEHIAICIAYTTMGAKISHEVAWTKRVASGSSATYNA